MILIAHKDDCRIIKEGTIRIARDGETVWARPCTCGGIRVELEMGEPLFTGLVEGFGAVPRCRLML